MSSCTKRPGTAVIHDLYCSKAGWKKFHAINIVDHNDKKFDAENGPDKPSGPLGPVKLIPLTIH